jgi:hypothetical protein
MAWFGIYYEGKMTMWTPWTNRRRLARAEKGRKVAKSTPRRLQLETLEGRKLLAATPVAQFSAATCYPIAEQALVSAFQTPQQTPSPAVGPAPFRAAAAASPVNLQATSLSYTPGGDQRKWATVGVKVTRSLSVQFQYNVRLYWSETSTVTARSIWAGERTISLDRTNSGSGNIWFAKSEITPRPANAKYLIAVLDPTNAIKETKENDNSQYFKL